MSEAEIEITETENENIVEMNNENITETTVILPKAEKSEKSEKIGRSEKQTQTLQKARISKQKIAEEKLKAGCPFVN